MHPQQIIDTLAPAYSGAHAKHLVAEIARYHRIQATPDFRAAATWMAAQLAAAGVQATIEQYPADTHSHFGVLPSFQEWDCRQALLEWPHADGSERLCDYYLSPVDVIQRSCAVLGDFDVVDVGKGGEEDYAGIDVRGKLVLSPAPVDQTYERAVVAREAAGILFDTISATVPGRNPIDLPDARQYSSFWWREGQLKTWGFVLSPRQGHAIRRALADGQSVRLHAHIDASFYDGSIEVVSATIPGQSDESVLATAHLCHPYGFANDNASGAACLLELATTLQRLIADGSLPQPQRSIRFLWVPEMTGSYAWLHDHPALIPTIKAGINLDMVGQRQESTGSVWVLEEPPAAMASFAPDLLATLRDLLLQKVADKESHVHFSRLRTTTAAFSGGSDHMVTSDPSVGIPTPMLIQWPDRFYHTTADTLEHVDPQSLWLSGVLAGSYLVWLALADAAAGQWLGWEMLARSEQRLARQAQAAVTALLAIDDVPARAQAWAQLRQKMVYWQERAQRALVSLQRLAPMGDALPAWQAELATIAGRVQERSRQQIQPHTLPSPAPTTDDRALPTAHLIPVRHYWGPVMDFWPSHPSLDLSADDVATWRQLAVDHPGWRVLRAQAEYWADGQRSLAEIAHLLQMETGQALGPAIETYFRLLARAGLMTLAVMNSEQPL